MRERYTNPCLGIARNPKKKIARFLDTDELARLGRAFDAHKDRWPEVVATTSTLPTSSSSRRRSTASSRRRPGAAQAGTVMRGGV